MKTKNWLKKHNIQEYKCPCCYRKMGYPKKSAGEKMYCKVCQHSWEF